MKRVYKKVEADSKALTVLLDDKPARTPMGKPLALPNKKIADAVAEEWDAQKKEIRKVTMPLTQVACIAIDLVPEKRSELINELLEYAQTDLVCYRAGTIPALQKEQEEVLNPIIAWVQHHLGIELAVTDGLMPVAQPSGNAMKLRTALSEMDDWTLAGCAAATKPLGSIILALALCEGQIDAEKAFQYATLEEVYETRQWGEDTEKQAKMERLKSEIASVTNFFTLLR